MTTSNQSSIHISRLLHQFKKNDLKFLNLRKDYKSMLVLTFFVFMNRYHIVKKNYYIFYLVTFITIGHVSLALKN